MTDEERRCRWCGSSLVTKSDRGWDCVACGWETVIDEEDDR